MLASIQDVAKVIQNIEGYYPGSLSYRLNNPGNLIYANQTGASPVTVGNHTWASFGSYGDGYNALLNQIKLDAGRGFSIESFVNKYAPPNENDSISYASRLANSLGLNVSDPLSMAINNGPLQPNFMASSGSGFDFASIFNGGNDNGNIGNYTILAGVGIIGFMLVKAIL